MSTIAELLVKLGIDTNEFQQGITNATSQTGGLGKAFGVMGGIGKGIAMGVGASFVAMGGFLAYATSEASEAQDVQAQLAAVLESTSGAAGVTVDMANQLADSLSQVTRFSDEAVLEGENLLLTFTSIGKDVFPDATAVMLDMSQALGQDLSSSAVQLGKALQDPITGVTALKRVGVNFTDSQMDMIKAMVEAGDVAGAQTLILEELQKEFGGSAEAAGGTFAGQLDILKNSLSNVAEGIGTALLPVLGDMMDRYIIPMIPHIQKLGEILAVALSGGDISGMLGSLPDQLQPIAKGLAWLAETLVKFVTEGIPAVIDGFSKFIGFLQDNQGVVTVVLGVLGVAVAAFALSFIASMVSMIISMAPLILVIMLIAGLVYLLKAAWDANLGGIQEKAAAVWEFIKTAAQGAIDFVVNLFNWLKTAWDTNQGGIQEKAAAAWEFIKGVISGAVTVITGIITWIGTTYNNVMELIHNLTSGKLGAWSALWSSTWEFIQRTFERYINIIKAIFAAVTAALHGDWEEFGKQLRVIWDNLWAQIKDTLNTAWANIKVIVAQLVTSIKDFFKNTDWAQVGKDVVNGIISGLKSMVSAVGDAAYSIAKAIYDVIVGFFSSKSPSRLMMGVGKDVVMGMSLGMSDMASTAASVAEDIASSVAGSLQPEAMGAINESVAYSGTAAAPSLEGQAAPDVSAALERLMDLLDRMPESMARAVRDNLILVSQ